MGVSATSEVGYVWAPVIRLRSVTREVEVLVRFSCLRGRPRDDLSCQWVFPFWVTGEAIDELLAADDDHKSSKKRKYPEPGFAVERSGAAEGRGSYPIAFKLKAAAFTRVRCADGNSVGNHGAARVLGVAKKRIIE